MRTVFLSGMREKRIESNIRDREKIRWKGKVTYSRWKQRLLVRPFIVVDTE